MSPEKVWSRNTVRPSLRVSWNQSLVNDKDRGVPGRTFSDPASKNALLLYVSPSGGRGLPEERGRVHQPFLVAEPSTPGTANEASKVHEGRLPRHG